MSKREELARLVHNLMNASFDCGEWHDKATEGYDVVWGKSLKAEQELRDFLEPYLPKD